MLNFGINFSQCVEAITCLFTDGISEIFNQSLQGAFLLGFASFSYFDFDECHSPKGITREGKIITIKAAQSKKCEENLLLNSAKATIPPSPGSEVIDS